MIYPVVHELAADQQIPAAMACRVLKVSTSGYYAWRDRPISAREQSNMELVQIIWDIHCDSRHTYGSPRVHAELRLGQGLRAGMTRVERLMRTHRIVGVHRRRRRGCTVRDPHAEPPTDLVQRQFRAERPDALWVSDIERHEALLIRVEVGDLHRRAVAAAR